MDTESERKGGIPVENVWMVTSFTEINKEHRTSLALGKSQIQVWTRRVGGILRYTTEAIK